MIGHFLGWSTLGSFLIQKFSQTYDVYKYVTSSSHIYKKKDFKNSEINNKNIEKVDP